LSLFTIKNYGLLAGVGLFAFINAVQVLLLIVAYNSVLRKSRQTDYNLLK